MGKAKNQKSKKKGSTKNAKAAKGDEPPPMTEEKEAIALSEQWSLNDFIYTNPTTSTLKQDEDKDGRKQGKDEDDDEEGNNIMQYFNHITIPINHNNYTETSTIPLQQLVEEESMFPYGSRDRLQLLCKRLYGSGQGQSIESMFPDNEDEDQRTELESLRKRRKQIQSLRRRLVGTGQALIPIMKNKWNGKLIRAIVPYCDVKKWVIPELSTPPQLAGSRQMKKSSGATTTISKANMKAPPPGPSKLKPPPPQRQLRQPSSSTTNTNNDSNIDDDDCVVVRIDLPPPNTRRLVVVDIEAEEERKRKRKARRLAKGAAASVIDIKKVDNTITDNNNKAVVQLKNTPPPQSSSVASPASKRKRQKLSTKQFHIGDRVYIPKDENMHQFHDTWGAWGRISKNLDHDEYEIAIMETGQRVIRPSLYILSYDEAIQEMCGSLQELAVPAAAATITVQSAPTLQRLGIVQLHPPPKQNFEYDGSEGIPFIPPPKTYDRLEILRNNIMKSSLNNNNNNNVDMDNDDFEYQVDLYRQRWKSRPIEEEEEERNVKWENTKSRLQSDTKKKSRRPPGKSPINNNNDKKPPPQPKTDIGGLFETETFKEKYFCKGTIVYAEFPDNQMFYWAEITGIVGKNKVGKKVYHLEFADGDECDQIADNMHSIDEALRLMQQGIVDMHLPPDGWESNFMTVEEKEEYFVKGMRVYAGFPINDKKRGHLDYKWATIISKSTERYKNDGRFRYRLQYVNGKHLFVDCTIMRGFEETLAFFDSIQNNTNKDDNGIGNSNISFEMPPAEWLEEYNAMKEQNVQKGEAAFENQDG